MKYCILLITFLSPAFSQAQIYFPPIAGDEWDTIEPSELNWCQENIDSLLSYLEAKNTRAFSVLKDGRIVLENYFEDHDENALWYWASAAKTITATLAGKALEEGLLNLDDPVSQYIGTGWTSCDSINEYQRTIFHQLTMSSSFNNSPILWNCLEPDCFQCTDSDPGTEWHYHNAVYRKLIEVVEAATGTDRNTYTNSVLEEITGMSGFWLEDFYFSKHRDLARFGLLALNGFEWDGTAVLNEPDYIEALTTPSQFMNQSYGYLWWLNGQSNHMFPLDPVQYEGSLIPTGPDDMYMALGASDQKIYVVPSEGLVVTRQGNAAFEMEAAASSFDVELWELISSLGCSSLSDFSSHESEKHLVFPNPSSGLIHFPQSENIAKITVHSIDGRPILNSQLGESIKLPKGSYVVSVTRNGGTVTRQRVIVQ